MSNKIIIGVCGFQSSGKDTVADYLVNTHGFRRMSFAGALKDAVSVIFGWDRELLEGRTRESREWRERVDTWWADKLNMPDLTPRWVLQYWGTEVCRVGFHDDIWIRSVEHRLMNISDNVVVSDVRFPNEIHSIKNSGGVVVRTHRGPDPEWWSDAVTVNRGASNNLRWATAVDRLKRHDIHSSETAWIGTKFDSELNNDGTIDELYQQIKDLLQSLQFST
jgi:hypothetical protein